ncbi:hypothetical protein Tco_0893671 [Tanacetum coccineum]|uniref:Secreted protein n=1 Tax=Tanacetum coccineum TaxID=301880 RepID=A0ABQ5CB08_9ASTR
MYSLNHALLLSLLILVLLLCHTCDDLCTQSNGFAGTKASDNASQARKETEPVKDYILLPLWTVDPPYSQDSKSSHDDGSKLQ